MFEEYSQYVSLKELGVRLRNIAISGVQDSLDCCWALEELQWDLLHIDADIDNLDKSRVKKKVKD